MPQFFVTTPKSLEELLAAELIQLGAESLKMTVAGVGFSGSWEVAARVLLWSRLAGRLLFPIAEFAAPTAQALYEGVGAVDWRAHMGTDDAFVVDASVTASAINHSQFAAQKVKDAIVDQFRDRAGSRPSVDKEHPDTRINLYLRKDAATLSIDLGAQSLHQRGYRVGGGPAPLKEHLAAALLIRAGWPEIAKGGGALVDPLCGSGTLLIEAALMAADIAPGLLRYSDDPPYRQGLDQDLWHRLRQEAEDRRTRGLANLVSTIIGTDSDSQLLRTASANAHRAGLGDAIQWQQRRLGNWRPEHTRDLAPGLVIANPPYGERLGELPELISLYATLGAVLEDPFAGWRASVFTGHSGLAHQIGHRAKRRYKFFNGAIPCELLNFEMEAGKEPPVQTQNQLEDPFLELEGGLQVRLHPGAVMLANRLRKASRLLAKWAAREGITCYRVYDADLPEYNAAIDRYGDYLVIQEYQAPPEIEAHKTERRLRDILLVAPAVLGVNPSRTVFKQRSRQRGKDQYERLAQSGSGFEIVENGLTFWVNLTDYLDTGIFLDHRPLRAMIRATVRNKRFLNLFAYTGSASVYAAAGGASSTLTVDMSKTYLDWARHNMVLNGFHENRHRFEQADCLIWLDQIKDRYDVILVDPPTFSNSKRMQGSFDVQRDHIQLLKSCARILSPEGQIFFSTNRRGFKLDIPGLAALGLDVQDLTRKTIPKDFERHSGIHSCWLLQRNQGSKT